MDLTDPRLRDVLPCVVASVPLRLVVTFASRVSHKLRDKFHGDRLLFRRHAPGEPANDSERTLAQWLQNPWVRVLGIYDCVHSNSESQRTVGNYEAGRGPNEFNDPHRVTFAPDGSVLVADRDNNRVHHRSEDGSLIRMISTDLMKHPMGLAVAGDKVVVSGGDSPDSQRRVLFVFNLSDGSFVCMLNTEIPLTSQEGIAASPDGTTVALTDLGSCASVRLVRLDGREEAPRRIAQGQLSNPCDVAFTPDGNHLVVADRGREYADDARDSIKIINATNGTVEHEWDCANVQSVAVDQGGNVVAIECTDKSNPFLHEEHEVTVFSPTGTRLPCAFGVQTGAHSPNFHRECHGGSVAVHRQSGRLAITRPDNGCNAVRII